MVSFSVVFDLVVKVIGSILLVALVVGSIAVCFVAWPAGPWWSALIWTAMTVALLFGCVGIMLFARDERKQ